MSFGTEGMRSWAVVLYGCQEDQAVNVGHGVGGTRLSLFLLDLLKDEYLVLLLKDDMNKAARNVIINYGWIPCSHNGVNTC